MVSSITECFPANMAFPEESSYEMMNTRMTPELSLYFYENRPTEQSYGKITKQLRGISKRCDWFIHSKSVIKKGVEKPKTIFLSMNRTLQGFEHFVDEVLPTLTDKFVLVVAGGDRTFPKGGSDSRFPEMTFPENQMRYRKLINNPYLSACFVENLDIKHKKLFPLPLGIVHKDPAPVPDTKLSFQGKVLKAMCIHRIHPGSSFQNRIKVSELALKSWKGFVHYQSECPRNEFIRKLKKYAFCICVHGGGLDPSPKAWEALAMGCIPIIQRSTLDGAYKQLPVVFVDRWDKGAISIEKMKKWLNDLRPYYENPKKRKEVIEKMGVEYWWQQILSKY